MEKRKAEPGEVKAVEKNKWTRTEIIDGIKELEAKNNTLRTWRERRLLRWLKNRYRYFVRGPESETEHERIEAAEQRRIDRGLKRARSFLPPRERDQSSDTRGPGNK